MGTMDELIDADVVEQLRGIAAGRGQRGGARSDWPGLADERRPRPGPPDSNGNVAVDASWRRGVGRSPARGAGVEQLVVGHAVADPRCHAAGPHRVDQPGRPASRAQTLTHAWTAQVTKGLNRPGIYRGWLVDGLLVGRR